MRLLAQVEGALQPLKYQKDLVLILEDWDEGLKVWQGIQGEEAQKVLKTAHEKYGPCFAFRVFNSQLDIWWNGKTGIIHDEPLKDLEEATKLFLEPDWRRYPGMQQFGQALCLDKKMPNLRPFYVKAVPVPIEQGTLWRFVELGSIKEGNDEDS